MFDRYNAIDENPHFALTKFQGYLNSFKKDFLNNKKREVNDDYPLDIIMVPKSGFESVQHQKKGPKSAPTLIPDWTTANLSETPRFNACSFLVHPTVSPIIQPFEW